MIFFLTGAYTILPDGQKHAVSAEDVEGQPGEGGATRRKEYQKLNIQNYIFVFYMIKAQ